MPDSLPDLDTLVKQATAAPDTSFAPKTIQKLESTEKAKQQELGPVEEQVKSQAQGDISEAQKKYTGIEPVDVKPWTQKVPERSPLEVFGSAGSVFAVIASAFTHTPMRNALNASAAAMNAIRSNDVENYKRAFEAWKENTQLAIDRHKMQHEDYSAALEKMRTDLEAGTAMLHVAATKYDDQMTLAQIEGGLLKEQSQMQEARQRSAMQLIQSYPQIENTFLKQQLLFSDPDYVTLKKKMDSGQPLSPEESQKFGEAVQRANMAMTPFSAQMTKIADAQNAYNSAKSEWIAAHPGEPFTSDVDLQIRSKVAAAMKGSGATSSSPEDRASMGAQAATGQPLTQVVPGWGQKASDDRKQARHDAIEFIKKENPGLTDEQAGQELAKRTIEYAAGKTSIGQLNTMLGATRQAVSQLDFNIEQAKVEMAKLPSTNLSPVINAIARGVQNWTGDPAYAGLYFYMNGVATESARLLAGGQASRAQLQAGAMEEAKKWANINLTPAMFDEVARSMHAEGEQRIKTFEDAMKAQQGGGGVTIVEPPSSKDPLGLFKP